MAKKTQDFSDLMKDYMGAFPVDTKAFEDAFKSQSALAENLSAVALNAADKSAEVSAKWTKSTISKLAEVSKAKNDPTDYAQAMNDFASVVAESAAENMASFAEIAKKVQTETLEIVTAAGRDVHEEFTAAAEKASQDLTAAAKKATAAAK